MEPSFLDILFMEYLFIGHCTNLQHVDAGKGEIAASIRAQSDLEMGDAQFVFGLKNTEHKLYKDLNIRESELGPNDALVTGEFA